MVGNMANKVGFGNSCTTYFIILIHRKELFFQFLYVSWREESDWLSSGSTSIFVITWGHALLGWANNT